MTAERDIELGRRAVACPCWRWMPGMRDTVGAICVSVDDGKPEVWWSEHEGGEVLAEDLPDEEPVLPDLRDAPTHGAILELVREAWRVHWRHKPGAVFPEVVIERVSGGWQWRLMSYCHDGDGRDSVALTLLGLIARSEREALVLALESAPLPRQTAEVGQ